MATYVSYIQREFAQAIALEARAIALLEDINDSFHLAAAYHRHGYNHLQTTGIDDLIYYTQKACDLARQTGNTFSLRYALGNLGSAALYQGRYHEAETYYRECIPLAEAFAVGASRGQAINFVHILLLLGKIEEGQQLLKTAWEDNRFVLESNGVAFGYAMYGFILALRNDPDLALLNALQALREARNDLSVTLVSHLIAGMACCGLGETAKAEEHLRSAWERSQGMDFFASATWGLPILVITSAKRGDYPSAVIYDALLRTHPLSATEWLDHWELLTETEAQAEQELDTDQYQQLWQQGQALQIEEVVSEWLAVHKI
jgi:tetratricopeptide (TPR) repeat protein